MDLKQSRERLTLRQTTGPLDIDEFAKFIQNCKNIGVTTIVIPSIEVTTHNFYNSCPICTELFKEGESVKELICKHLYHPICIDKWMERQPNCPVCRKAHSTKS